MFYIGQKVVCIDASPTKKYSPVIPNEYFIDDMDGLAKGEVYTIAGHGFVLDVPIVFLSELKRPPNSDGSEAGYHPNRFRPIVEKKTDISIFTKMLNKKQKELID